MERRRSTHPTPTAIKMTKKSGIDTDKAMTGILLDVLSFVDPIIWLVTTWDAISN